MAIKLPVVGMVVPIVMQGDAVELEERILDLVAGGGQSTVEGDPLHGPGPANVHAVALLDVAEVGRLVALGRMRHNRGFHVADEGPLRRAEERVGLDVRCSGASA